MGKIVLEDFNEGDGYYKINLAYLNKEQVEEIENLVSKWNPTDEDIKSCIAMCLTDVNEQRFKDYGTNLRDCLAWLEKQGEQKPAEEYNITGIGSKNAQGKLGEMIKNLKHDNEVLEQKPADEEMKEALRTEYEKGRADVIAEMQKPAWSEEDERKINRIYSILGQAADTHAFSTSCRLIGDKECIELQDWLKSLKQRIGE